MAKKIGVMVMGAFVVLFTGFNLYSYFSKGNSSTPISGYLVKDLPGGISMSLLAFILQWVLLLGIVIFAYMRFLKHRKEEDAKVAGFVMPQLHSKSETYLDVFYDLLKEKKALSIRTIAKLFNLKKETALDWAKVLEDHNLATIEYPAFSDPEVKIKGAEIAKPKKENKKDGEKVEDKKIEQNKKEEKVNTSKQTKDEMVVSKNEKVPQAPEVKKEEKSVEKNPVQEIKKSVNPNSSPQSISDALEIGEKKWN